MPSADETAIDVVLAPNSSLTSISVHSSRDAFDGQIVRADRGVPVAQ
jgi:hypothetical protein